MIKKFNQYLKENSTNDVPGSIERADLIGQPYKKQVGYSFVPDIEIKHAIEFPSSGTFGAIGSAESYLKENGYSIGSMERDSPIGFSDIYDYISKWGNMSGDDHKELDGCIIPGDSLSFREGSAIILWFDAKLLYIDIETPTNN